MSPVRPAPTGRAAGDAITDPYVDPMEAAAAEVLPEAVHRYVRQGAGAGLSTGEAVAAWDRLRLLPRVLRDVGTVDIATSLLGTRVRGPVGIAPTTLQRAVHPDGELAMARAVAACDSLMVVSSNAGTRFADLAATGVAWWLQMYVTADRSRSLPLLTAAVESGARAICLTADAPVVGTKDDGGRPTVWDAAEPGWVRANFASSDPVDPALAKAADLGPADVAWLHEVTGLPVVVKGVLRADDARRCVEAGAAAVWVSNHGGRQLARAASTSACLGPVCRALEGSGAEVYVDGGLRCGEHVLAALALGARGVFLGRSPLYALAVSGERGVVALLDRLGEELTEALTLCGCARPEQAEPDLVDRPEPTPGGSM